jgi:uncharacterized protein YdiU (UPF0061 family)
MRVGFVHGVMNTDNLSILGLTIDTTALRAGSTISIPTGRRTPPTQAAKALPLRLAAKIAYWNLTRLAHALSPLFGRRGAVERRAAAVTWIAVDA